MKMFLLRLLAILAKSIAIAIAILCEKIIAILIAIFFPSHYCNTIAILFAILYYLLPQINYDFCGGVQLFLNFWVYYILRDNVVNTEFKL